MSPTSYHKVKAEDAELSETDLNGSLYGFVGRDKAVKTIRHKITQVAATDATVLILGETGTGKELIARGIHAAGSRKTQPLVTINCGALVPTLIESELFGHEKGAFTGAGNRKLGRFELANRGTLFLDEIGELPLDLQAKLLRVLEHGEFERVGNATPIKTDMRIIAATNRDLKHEVAKGNFRQDLWFRLNVFQITTPPLRQRVDDIPVLVNLYVRRICSKLGTSVKAVSPAVMSQFCNYSWPGNIRELANVIERAVILSPGANLELDYEFDFMKSQSQPGKFKTLKEMERQYITQVLEDRGWRIDGQEGAARVLGIDANALRRRMTSLGIDIPTTQMNSIIVASHSSEARLANEA